MFQEKMGENVFFFLERQPISQCFTVNQVRERKGRTS